MIKELLHGIVLSSSRGFDVRKKKIDRDSRLAGRSKRESSLLTVIHFHVPNCNVLFFPPQQCRPHREDGEDNSGNGDISHMPWPRADMPRRL